MVHAPVHTWFNRDGLWHHEDIGFSRHGSLTATIGQLVRRSSAGLSARELGEKLQHPCFPVLTHLYQDRVLDRVPVQGEFRYLAIEGTLNSRQREVALAAALPSPGAVLYTQAAVLVLVAHIKQPELSFEQLAAGLKIQGHGTSTESIQRFFAEHGFKKNARHPGAITVSVLQHYREKLARENRTAALFAQRPRRRGQAIDWFVVSPMTTRIADPIYGLTPSI
jgi:hypothetical protein